MNLTTFVGVTAQNSFRKCHFMDAESVHKILTIFNLATTSAIMVRLTLIVYLLEIFNLTKHLGVTNGTKESINQKPLRMSQKFSLLS